jgi:hypothetical protein
LLEPWVSVSVVVKTVCGACEKALAGLAHSAAAQSRTPSKVDIWEGRVPDCF